MFSGVMLGPRGARRRGFTSCAMLEGTDTAADSRDAAWEPRPQAPGEVGVSNRFDKRSARVFTLKDQMS